MSLSLSRRDVLKVVGAGCLAGVPEAADAGPLRRHAPGWIVGQMTGAEALVETLLQECVGCVFGIPGAQENELWDAMKTKHLPYLLVTHEFSAACMADGYARSTGKPGVLCIVPGPGLTNSPSGLGEALLDSVPVVCIVGDVARHGAQAHAFQVHNLDQAALLQPVTKRVFAVQNACEIPNALRQAFQCACAGEPGPVGVVVPYNLLIESCRYNCGPLGTAPVPFDPQAGLRALQLLSDARLRVGIYAGYGCMDQSEALVRLAELLQAPVATSMAGKGAFPENHPLSVGWGYGPQGRRTAEEAFKHRDLVLALGVKYSEVSTGYYSDPQSRYLIHVDINPDSLGKVMRTTVCVNSDVGAFLQQAFEQENCLRRPANSHLVESIRVHKCAEAKQWGHTYARCGVDPMCFVLALRRATCPDALAFVDVTVSQYLATEAFTVCQPRTFFNPTNNQAMGWSIPAALGAQRVHPGRQVVTITGDGCFLMSGMEISTAAREHLPVKFFILDDQAYHYMQELQRAAYLRTTATMLARLDYRALAQGWGVGYEEIGSANGLDARLQEILACPGPTLVRVVTDYHRRPIRWIQAARGRFAQDLTLEQKRRFLARIGTRALDPHPLND
jgi:acetolactate synthase I/II/III large subunit